MLRLHGFIVHEAANCEDALHAIYRERRAVLVSDVVLSAGPSGLDLMREVSRRGLRVRGVAVSGHAGAEHATNAKAAGFDDYIVKPFLLDGFLAKVRELAAAA